MVVESKIAGGVVLSLSFGEVVVELKIVGPSPLLGSFVAWSDTLLCRGDYRLGVVGACALVLDSWQSLNKLHVASSTIQGAAFWTEDFGPSPLLGSFVAWSDTLLCRGDYRLGVVGARALVLDSRQSLNKLHVAS